MIGSLDAGHDVGTWSSVPPIRQRVVLLAPHPDDEILGSAGLLCWLAARAVPTAVLAVTDGERSHPRSRRTSPARLRAQRSAERSEALRRAGLDLPIRRLGLPDGGVAGHEAALEAELASELDEATTVVAPWAHDGHPDHEATGRAARRAVAASGANLVEVLIWARVRDPHRGGPDDGATQALRLGPSAAATKIHAASSFVTQLAPLAPGGDPADGPVVHPDEAARLLDGIEAYRW